MQSLDSQKYFRLLSKSRLKKGLVRVSSSSDGIVDLAAAAELGLIENNGLVALIPEKTRVRAVKLLKANVLFLVKAKQSTVQASNLKQIQRVLVKKAFPTVIGPMYFQTQLEAGFTVSQTLDRMRFAKWVKQQIETNNSNLNLVLAESGFEDICDLVRSAQWWGRLLQHKAMNFVE
jgi:hypothetical protein